MKCLFAAVLCAFLVTHAGAASAPARPNIVVILVDDMGVMDTSLPFLTDAAGQAKRYPLNDFYRTPNMERLAARGIRFNQFCAMSVCSPTRIAIMTGQNAARHRTTNWINPDTNNAGPNGAPDWNWQGLKRGDVTLAGLLQAGGYQTIHVGKGHFGPRASAGAEPLTLGFDANVGGEIAHAVGAKMQELGKAHQVLCISHLPQVAALAHSQFVVTKQFTKDRTFSQLTHVDGEARVEEIARMLGGKGDSALAHARTLLKA